MKWTLFISLCGACVQPAQHLVYAPEEAGVQLRPDPIPLVRGDPCGSTTLRLEGSGILQSMAFVAEVGEQSAVLLPPIRELDFSDSVYFQIDYCPVSPAPSAGWVLLSFQEQPEDLAIWAEEA